MKSRIIIAPNSQLCNKQFEVLEFPGFVSLTMWMKGSVKREDTSKNQSHLDKAPRLSISIVIWILPSDTETSAATPLGGGARKVLAK